MRSLIRSPINVMNAVNSVGFGNVSTGIEFRQQTLPNGLQIVAELMPGAYTAAFGYFVRSGARDETDAQAGLSHFLEHMVFKGTSQRSAAQVNRELDELGGQSNAYTSEEQTVYYATVLPKYQRRIVDLLSDLMQPTLAPQDFETERLVILEEIAKYEDQPPFGAFERSMEMRFGHQGLGRRILGTTQSIKTMTAAAMRSYFQQRYLPSNMVLAAAGNVDFEALVQQAGSLTAHWPTASASDSLRFPACDQPPADVQSPPLQRGDTSMAYVIRLADAPSSTDPDHIAMRLLATIIGDDSGSRFFWELIDSGRADAAATWTQEFLDCGLFMLYLSCDRNRLDGNLRLIDRIVSQVRQQGVTNEELEQAINKTTSGLVMHSERPGNRLFSLGSRWLMKQEYLSVDQTIAKYRQVDVAAVQHVLERFDLTTKIEVHADR